MEKLNQFLEDSSLSPEDKKQISEIYQASLNSFHEVQETLKSEDWEVDKDDFDESDVIDDLDWDTTINDAIDELVDKKREEKKEELRERIGAESYSTVHFSIDLLQGKFRSFLQVWREYAKAKNFFLTEETLEKIVCGEINKNPLDLDMLEDDFIYFLSNNLPKERA